MTLAPLSHCARRVEYSDASMLCLTLEFVTKITTLGSFNGTKRLSSDLKELENTTSKKAEQ